MNINPLDRPLFWGQSLPPQAGSANPPQSNAAPRFQAELARSFGPVPFFLQELNETVKELGLLWSVGRRDCAAKKIYDTAKQIERFYHTQPGFRQELLAAADKLFTGPLARYLASDYSRSEYNGKLFLSVQVKMSATEPCCIKEEV